MTTAGTLGSAVRIDATCDAFERAWKDGPPPSIERFARGWGGPERTALLRELVGIDADYRAADPDAELPDYAARFPELAGGEVPRALGQYVLLARVGAGGMGTVYRAVHRRMRREVAVKVLRAAPRGHDARLRALFGQEVRAAAKLSHPNVVAAYDAGEDKGQPYLVFEFVAGEDLASVVRRRGPLTAAVAIDYVLQAARGLAYVHEQGLTHRDVKPANLMLDDDGVVRVLDVGLAHPHASAAGRPGEPAVGGVAGTPGFMAPEQAADPPSADARADVYSLGCTLHFLLAGGIHVPGENAACRPTGCPRAHLDPLLRKMLARRPADRPPSMRAVIRDLERLRRGRRRRRSTRRRLLGGLPLLALAACVPAAFLSTAAPPPVPPTVLAAPFDARIQQERWATHLKLPVARTHATGMTFRLVPPGRCWLGSADDEIGRMVAEEPNPDVRRRLATEARRPATLAAPLYVGTTEVTAGQFRRFVEATGYVTEVERDRRPAFGLRAGSWVQAVGYSWRDFGQRPADDLPVGNVAYADAAAFCDWLTATAADGSRYRLPTEAEWEHACRAGSAGTWPFGDTPSLLTAYAWCRPNAGDADNQMRPVATRSPNALGLYDMLGNVQELCVVDPTPRRGWVPELVFKGGDIGGGPLLVRPAARNPTYGTSVEGGFRVVVQPPAN